MYKRPPERSSQSIKIPKNYSGSAFRSMDSAAVSFPEPNADRYLPVSDFPEQNEEKPTVFSHAQTIEDEPMHKEAEKISNFGEKPALPTASKPQSDSKKQADSLFSSLLPSNITSSKHFPFGHGIGSEEILILAMMLLVYLSEGETDNEFLLLLGLLLFAG